MKIISKSPEAFLKSLIEETPNGLTRAHTGSYSYTFERKPFAYAYGNNRFLGQFLEDGKSVFFILPLKSYARTQKRFEALLNASPHWKPCQIDALTTLNASALLARDQYRPESSYRLYTASKSVSNPAPSPENAQKPPKTPLETAHPITLIPLKALRKARASLKKGAPVQEVLEILALPIDYQFSILPIRKAPK